MIDKLVTYHIHKRDPLPANDALAYQYILAGNGVFVRSETRFDSFARLEQLLTDHSARHRDEAIVPPLPHLGGVEAGDFVAIVSHEAESIHLLALGAQTLDDAHLLGDLIAQPPEVDHEALGTERVGLLE